MSLRFNPPPRHGSVRHHTDGFPSKQTLPCCAWQGKQTRCPSFFNRARSHIQASSTCPCACVCGRGAGCRGSGGWFLGARGAGCPALAFQAVGWPRPPKIRIGRCGLPRGAAPALSGRARCPSAEPVKTSPALSQLGGAAQLGSAAALPAPAGSGARCCERRPTAAAADGRRSRGAPLSAALSHFPCAPARFLGARLQASPLRPGAPSREGLAGMVRPEGAAAGQ